MKKWHRILLGVAWLGCVMPWSRAPQAEAPMASKAAPPQTVEREPLPDTVISTLGEEPTEPRMAAHLNHDVVFAGEVVDVAVDARERAEDVYAHCPRLGWHRVNLTRDSATDDVHWSLLRMIPDDTEPGEYLLMLSVKTRAGERREKLLMLSVVAPAGNS